METPQPAGYSKPEAIWAIMPIRANPAYTVAAIGDLLAQTVPVRILLVNQGVDDAFRDTLERIAEEHADRVLLWSHQPPLPSLSATWNRALDAVWASGAEAALVVNNDVRLNPRTIEYLCDARSYFEALFVSAVGVTVEQFDATYDPYLVSFPTTTKGGPDFSCFLISAACHARFRFDEGFVPAFCEDLDYHRRLLLAGEGTRIFSVNLPYLHYGSATLKSVEPAERQRIERQIEQGSRAYYAKKWGGPVNQERYRQPFDPESAADGLTTPQLQWEAQTAPPVAPPNVIAETEV